MSLLGNIVWITLCGGWLIFLEYLVAAVGLTVTIVGIPFAAQCVKLALLGLAPFGHEVVPGKSSMGCVSTVMNILWLIPGVGIALTHAIAALILAITIVGIPFAKQHLKLAALALAPFGKEIR